MHKFSKKTCIRYAQNNLCREHELPILDSAAQRELPESAVMRRNLVVVAGISFVPVSVLARYVRDIGRNIYPHYMQTPLPLKLQLQLRVSRWHPTLLFLVLLLFPTPSPIMRRRRRRGSEMRNKSQLAGPPIFRQSAAATVYTHT